MKLLDIIHTHSPDEVVKEDNLLPCFVAAMASVRKGEDPLLNDWRPHLLRRRSLKLDLRYASSSSSSGSSAIALKDMQGEKTSVNFIHIIARFN